MAIHLLYEGSGCRQILDMFSKYKPHIVLTLCCCAGWGDEVGTVVLVPSLHFSLFSLLFALSYFIAPLHVSSVYIYLYLSYLPVLKYVFKKITQWLVSSHFYRDCLMSITLCYYI